MTIYTPKTGEKKDDSNITPPEVVTESVPLSPEKKLKSGFFLPPPPPSPTLVTIATRRRKNNCANLCVLFTALVVLATGIIGGIYLYKHLAHRTFHGWCGVRYYEFDDDDPKSRQARHKRLQGHFEERIEFDKEEGKYEKIEVPEFEECKKATVLHDFEKNLTAIVDKSEARCFILPLNRSMVRPPKDFWDLMLKLKTGYYLPDAELVREKYEVRQPAVRNLNPFGYYIWRECRYYDTYQLQKMPNDQPIAMVKRSACKEQLGVFAASGGFGGKLEIINIYQDACK